MAVDDLSRLWSVRWPVVLLFCLALMKGDLRGNAAAGDRLYVYLWVLMGIGLSPDAASARRCARLTSLNRVALPH